MLRYVLGKELKDCPYGYRSLLLFVLSTVLSVVAAYAGSREYPAALEDHRLAQAAHRKHLAEEANLYPLFNFGFSIAKPPPVLGILVSGVEPHTPRVYNLGLYTLPQPHGSAGGESPATAVFGALDLAFAVEAVLDLGALLFTFSTVCGEKELGTLKLQLANALPKDTLLLGKLVGNLVGLFVPVTLTFVLACLVLAGVSEIALGHSELLRILLLELTFVLYLAAPFALGLCISTLTTRTTTAFTLCLVVWVVPVGTIAKSRVLTAKRISPAESLQEFEMKKVLVHRKGPVEAQVEFNKYIEQHNGQMPPLELCEEMQARVRHRQNQELRKPEEDYAQKKERQARVALML